MNTPKTVVITGASSGIGAALARMLAPDGHRLALAARRKELLQEIAHECGPNALAVVTDVTKRGDHKRLRDTTIERFGQIDVWINNAGRGIGKKVLELTDQDLDAMIDDNLRSVLYGMQTIMAHFMSRGEGHLINVSSMLSRVPWAPVRSAYSAAKAAMNSLTANVRMDLREQYPNIRVSLVLPAIVTTEFADNALGGTPGFRPPVGSPLVRTPEEVAAVIAELIRHPRAEVYTHEGSKENVLRYFQDVAEFERNWPPKR